MLHQPSLNRAFFARCRAGGDAGNRTGVILGDVENRADVVFAGR
jgi:hypothetical protein